MKRRNPATGSRGATAQSSSLCQMLAGAEMNEHRLPALLVLAFCISAWAILGSGCSDGVRSTSAGDIAEFYAPETAGASIDMERILQARIPSGPYRVVAGDILRLEIPKVLDSELQETEPASDGRASYNCRVDDEGRVLLPIVGWITVAGKSLAEIESAVLAQYYPKYVKVLLPVYASMLEYHTYRVSMIGAVAKPGVYAVRHDQMSLVALLTEAGGIVEKGATVIRISRQNPVEPPRAGTQAFALPLERQGGRGAEGRFVTAGALDVAFREVILPASDVRVRATFERQGPLTTTGWLAIERDRKVLIRKWLDIGNESQRHSFLAAAPAAADGATADSLNRKLAQLAEYLESHPQPEVAPPAIEHEVWEQTGPSQFTAPLQVPVTSRSQFAGTAPMPADRITESGAKDRTLVLPVRGLNIPFADVAIEEGDSVIVEGPSEQYVSVVGLVARPGNMPYPPNARYTLIQAIAFAGGLDLVADPRYVSIYRLKPDGEVASATIRLVNPKSAQQLTQALALPLRPGDVVAVEHTPRTRMNVFCDRFFRTSLGLGVYLTPESSWGGNGNHD